MHFAFRSIWWFDALKPKMVLPFKFSVIDIIDQGRTTSKDIDLIKEWNMNLKEKCIPILSNELVTIFLLSCSNDINHTKKTIENYYKIKQLAPVLFNDRNTDSEEFQLTVNTSWVFWILNFTTTKKLYFFSENLFLLHLVLYRSLKIPKRHWISIISLKIFEDP